MRQRVPQARARGARAVVDARCGAKALTVIETYQAKHGWVLRDTPVYDAHAAERHWETLVALLDRTFK